MQGEHDLAPLDPSGDATREGYPSSLVGSLSILNTFR